MAGRRKADLSPGEWAVLALIAERPTHGFAVAKDIGPGGEIGNVWTLPRPLVYRALDTLQAAELIAPRRTEPGQGPRRTVFAATRRGRRLVDTWLDQPVEHVRDARTLLLLKLLFLDRAGRDAGVLLRAQLGELKPLEVALRRKARSATGFERTLAVWRLETTRAAIRTVNAALAETTSPAGPPSP
jgi:PadR family transcriptional regulator AphA